MSAIDTSMLNAMREAISQLLPDTCTIQTVTRASDGMGGMTETWSNTYTNVSCRVDLITRDINEMVKGAAVQPYPQYQLSVPYDTTLTVNDRIVHNSITYMVVKVNTSQSWMAVKRAILELT